MQVESVPAQHLLHHLQNSLKYFHKRHSYGVPFALENKKRRC
nr:MAG TPA: hypothetical protein [Caudoviricetes sp.]